MPRSFSDPPDISKHYGRLRWARENAGFSSIRAAAKAFEWDENVYKSHEQGERQKHGFKEATAKVYARKFGVSVEWLMTGRGTAVRGQSDEQWAELSPEERARALRLYRAAS